MRKLRTISLVSLILALLALFAVGGLSSPYPVHAQGSCTPISGDTWCFVFDFTTSNFGGIFSTTGTGYQRGSYTAGVGYQTSYVPDEGDGTARNDLAVAFDAPLAISGFPATINHMQYFYDFSPGAGVGVDAPWEAWAYAGAGNTGGSSVQTVDSDVPTSGTSSYQFDFTGSPAFGSSFSRLQAGWHSGTGVDPGGSLTWKKLIISGTGSFIPTYTPSPTGTIPPSGSGGLGFEGQCLLLGDDSSLFMTLPGAWTLDPSTLTHGTGGTGLKLEIGQASIVLNLNKYHKYQIALRFHVEDSGSGDIFSFKLGSTSATTVSVEASADEQTFVTASGGQNFEPDDPASSDIYTFTLKELLHVEDNGTLVIDLACIEDRTPDVQLVPPGGEDSPPGVCQSCDYTPTGNLLNDLMAIFAWLWCGLSQLFDCVLKPLLLGLWRAIVDILRWLNFVRMWAGLIWTNLGAWLGNAWTQFLYWLIGAMNNVQTAFKNIVFAFFDSPIGAFLVNSISAILNNPLSAIIANTAHTVETVAGSVGNIIQIGAYYLGLIFNAVVTILGAIPEIFIALVNGYNASPTSIPVWAPTCNSANTFLYYPCLGSYILDNTLLDGPAYLMFILLLGLVAINTVLWTVRQLQEALAK